MGIKRRQNLRRNKRMKRLRNRSHNPYRFILPGIVVVVLLVLAVFAFYFCTHAKFRYTLEAGESFEVNKLWTGIVGHVTKVDGGEEPNSSEPDTYLVKVKVGIIPFTSKVRVNDTKAPSGQAVTKQMEYGGSCDISAFVQDVQDATKVTMTYEREPDFYSTGRQEIIVLLEDTAKNQSRISSTLFIPNVKSVLQIEMGEAMVEASAFLIHEGSASFLSDISQMDLSKTGDKNLQIQVDGEPYDVILRIRDNTAPLGQAVEVSGPFGKSIKADAFVSNIVDETSVTIAYRNEPNFELEGEQGVLIVLTDEGGNETLVESKLTLIKDKEAPLISGDSITVEVGGNISYKQNITATDNYDKPEEIKLKFDNAGVNLNQIGIYVVRCTATDTSGNKSEKNITVNVLDKGSIQIEETTVNEMADRVLDGIIYNGMSLYDKAHAIYLWITQNVGYVTHSEKMSWIEGAYEGIQNRVGDCFVFAATSKILLTRANIQNLDITKSTSKPRSHYWNLVDIGQGWYHFDTTPRSDNDNFFMSSDEKVKAYSDSHSGSHQFVRSRYPHIN